LGNLKVADLGKRFFLFFFCFFVYFDGLLKVISVSSMKVFLGSGFGKYEVIFDIKDDYGSCYL